MQPTRTGEFPRRGRSESVLAASGIFPSRGPTAHSGARETCPLGFSLRTPPREPERNYFARLGDVTSVERTAQLSWLVRWCSTLRTAYYSSESRSLSRTHTVHPPGHHFSFRFSPFCLAALFLSLPALFRNAKSVVFFPSAESPNAQFHHPASRTESRTLCGRERGGEREKERETGYWHRAGEV